MLLGIAGVTGVGKTYYKNLIADKLGFHRIITITTRAPRADDHAGDKLYVTPEEMQAMLDDGKIAYDLETLGSHYAYSKEELLSDRNAVFEVHYDTIFDLKKVCPELHCLYLYPSDLEAPKNRLRERKLDKKTEDFRLAEIDEHYHNMETNKTLHDMFDHFMFNAYDSASDEAVIDYVVKLLEKGTL